MENEKDEPIALQDTDQLFNPSLEVFLPDHFSLSKAIVLFWWQVRSYSAAKQKRRRPTSRFSATYFPFLYHW
jgi:hypothetical protein